MGDLSADVALTRILTGTGFTVLPRSGTDRDCPAKSCAKRPRQVTYRRSSDADLSGASLETVTVTSSKIGGDVQNIPIAITALSQEQLTATQTAGGPDLVKQVPNLTFTKTNFTGYSASRSAASARRRFR